jgi:hypothetical protein
MRELGNGELKIGRGNRKNSEKDLPQCYFFQDISHKDYTGIEPKPPL